MSMTQDNHDCNQQYVQRQLDELLQYVRNSVRDSLPIHQVERELWKRVLELGRNALGLFLQLQGDGDRGDRLTLPDGRDCQRLEKPHERRYVSVFGEFRIRRMVYGSRGNRLHPIEILCLPESGMGFYEQGTVGSSLEHEFWLALSPSSRDTGVIRISRQPESPPAQEPARPANSRLENRYENLIDQRIS
jgi:hypothetical protein